MIEQMKKRPDDGGGVHRTSTKYQRYEAVRADFEAYGYNIPGVLYDVRY